MRNSNDETENRLETIIRRFCWNFDTRLTKLLLVGLYVFSAEQLVF
jgi:hypothetical protein